jgi:hypothetical protein
MLLIAPAFAKGIPHGKGRGYKKSKISGLKPKFRNSSG